jgi:hypothetical protein
VGAGATAGAQATISRARTVKIDTAKNDFFVNIVKLLFFCF